VPPPQQPTQEMVVTTSQKPSTSRGGTDRPRRVPPIHSRRVGTRVAPILGCPMATSRATPSRSTKRLGDPPLEAGVVTEAQLSEVLEEQKRTGKRMAQIFIERGLL